MASLKDMRTRIASVKATRKITKAMQMVAAAKLRRAQEAAQAARPYAQRMDQILANLNRRLASKEGVSPLLVGTGKDDVHLLIVMTAERGLCGGFNTNISRRARQDIRRLAQAGKTVKVLCVGRKGYEPLKRQFEKNIIEVVELRSNKGVTFADAQAIAGKIADLYAAGEFDIATQFYSRFQSVISQVPTAQQIIPATFPDAGTAGAPAADYDYEPGEAEILAELLPRNLAVQIFKALLENGASEQGARMSAMDNATRNAGDMIKKQTLTYNRTRQAMITKELIEIISGAEAL